ncbi:MAG: PEP-CTERM sorting domain-containing protein [Verrucomicrobia bacterium]|nr:PEP-CTERM sorting domain-containing protein [Verrucomicrobiota bacterium]
MKLASSRSLLCLLLAASALLAPAARADITENFSFTLGGGSGTIIPDNDPTGLSDTRTLSSFIGSITSVKVTLTIAGGFNGDLYAFLLHTNVNDPSGLTDGFAVLLNRVGRTGSTPDGYADSGFTTVTFDGSALNDIHTYQTVTNPGGGALIGGVWAVDGRETDPALVTTSDPRTALLSSFNGLDASGDWTLFIVDNAQFGQGTLVSWSLQITGIPEPGTLAAGVGLLGTLACTVARRRRAPR